MQKKCIQNKTKYSINGKMIPRIGQGGYGIGENKSKEKSEIKALIHGIKNGANLIDTAESYGNGNSEKLIGKALRYFNRNDYIIVSKFLPENSILPHIIHSLERSLENLQIEYLDLYLLHWNDSLNLSETIECLNEFKNKKKILEWGVSNFDVLDMENLLNLKGGNNCFCNQVMYNLGSRGIEYDLLNHLNEKNILCMAYSPLADGAKLKRMNRDYLNNKILIEISRKYEVSIYALLLAFVLKQPNLIGIPKASSIDHIKENLKALWLVKEIEEKDWIIIDEEFPPPTLKMHLDIN